ncbi:MAG: 4-hydroxybutyrate CoA-transferase, partial [Actinobacteria bacterium]|nr:4-hydroxybutyrate CoA-transferase [Actinomycetota bacterium]
MATVRTLSSDAAAALIEPTDALGLPLGTGQPVRFVEALGQRDDWVDLKIYAALLTVLSDVFVHPNVHYLSGFYGPLERMLRAQG